MQLSKPSLTRAGLWRIVRRRRRAVAASFAATSVFLVVAALRPTPEQTVTVVLASHDLPVGQVLSIEDVYEVAWPAALAANVVTGSAAELLGARLTLPVRQGTPLDSRATRAAAELVGLPKGTAAIPVRLADSGQAALLHAGDTVDLLAAVAADAGAGGGAVSSITSGGSLTPGAPRARRIAAGVLVLAVPTPAPGSGSEGGLVLVAASELIALELAGAEVDSRLSVVIRNPSVVDRNPSVVDQSAP